MSQPEMLTPLEQFELMANDEFHLLEAVGPHEFSTSHLLELREQAIVRLSEFDRRKKINMMIGATSAGWVIAFAASWWYGSFWLGAVAVAGLLFSLTAFFAGVWLLSKKTDSRSELEHSLFLINDELRTR